MVKLDPTQRTMLLEVLDMHLQGMDDTREAMIDDSATLRTFEDFTETLQQHDIDRTTVESIKRGVLEDDD